VTSQIIEMLEKGTAPWQTPWNADALHLPFNPTTDRTYRGGNALHLMAVGARKGFNDPRWLIYRQAQENGWQVRKGEKGSQIEFWQFDAGPKASPDQADTLGDTLHSWREETARMWRFTRNNGITEGFHNKMETISRQAYGYRSFENYRQRVLLVRA
jgi:antirestriction protein ArdC